MNNKKKKKKKETKANGFDHKKIDSPIHIFFIASCNFNSAMLNKRKE